MPQNNSNFKELDITVDTSRLKKTWIGIDNGKQGGIVVIDEYNQVVEKMVMPMIGQAKGTNYDLHKIYEVIEKYQPVCVAIEKTMAMGPMTSKTAARMVGYSQGIAEMACVAAEVPYVVIAPKEWQKFCFAGLTQKDTKVASVLYAKKMQPKEDWRRSERCKNDHDGMTDAYGIAVYCHCKFFVTA